ncbi:hypothetical protein FA13DRAFT_1822518 [Coprinellus micaceus]|uniref:Uncharacterized protein n=1 Tax=Coprinellus micaceus TaxID=71717 RepID=A0A4Y7S7W4_COPMI|nr:hypothetical protein FA13DRAFT_1822518 [Coprinellus micaceus]
MSASPIQHLPNDVLQEIFLWCLPVPTWKTTLIPSEAPVLLTHVCQRWRQVSWDFPVLWATLRWDVQRIHVTGMMVETLAVAVSRARLHPLNLQLVLRTRTWNEDEERTDGFYPIPNIMSALLAPTTSSLTRLVLRGIPLSQMHALSPNSFPSLVDLVLRLPGTDMNRFPWSAKGPLNTFSDAPSLRRVCLSTSLSVDRSEPESHVSQHIVLPWHQLTHFLDFDAPDEPLSSSLSLHLPEFSNLQYLFATLGELDVGRQGFQHWSDTRPARLNKLRSLTLYFWGCDEGEVGYTPFIDAFEFPNLKALRLDGAEFNFDDDSLDIWWPAELADRFISKLSSLQYLTYLSLCVSSIAPDTLRRVLLATPHVTTLDAFVYENYENFFEGITWGVDKLLPKLETLLLELDNSVAIDDGEGDTIDPDAFHLFLQSRVCNVECPSFRKIVVYSGYEDALEDDVYFIQLALQFVPEGLVFERRLVSEERASRANHLWMERDPELHDWPELAAAQ